MSKKIASTLLNSLSVIYQ